MPGNSLLRARHRGKNVIGSWSTGHFPTSKILPVLLCVCRCNYYAIKLLKTTCVMPTQELFFLSHYDCNWLFGLMTDVLPDFGFCQLSGYKVSAGFPHVLPLIFWYTCLLPSQVTLGLFRCNDQRRNNARQRWRQQICGTAAFSCLPIPFSKSQGGFEHQIHQE